ncbi:hypothetical protein [Mesorhizobium sp. L48C026A00]|uniref:hypothetical protein n=1 Tax=Mesorhizobium sp. L48C026A00 TaxID=1287182 RepID=UPI0003CFD3FC|nr:hypothetical protein [Mesorhizobium sp. L48C026A00]ESZ11561.1 hypothetical protein X737_29420 [Mesorhizobium sp. L48C026A00]
MAEIKQQADEYVFGHIRLQQFNIKGLFGEHDYEIPLNLDQHVTAIIAPNGTGKTLCLRMIASLFERKWAVFYDTVFSQASYLFTDGTLVIINRKSPTDEKDEGENIPSIQLRIEVPNGEKIEWSPKLFDPKRPLQIERYLPFLTRIGPGRWRHDHTGEQFGPNEIIEAYGDGLPDAIRAGLYGKVPVVLTALTKLIDCRLIETQRLLILRDENEDPYYGGPGRRPRSTLAITRKAQALKEIISKEINAYATLSQSLDRSFPKRVINQTSQVTSAGLTDQLAELDTKRRELMEAGILDTEADDPVSLPEGPLNPAIARVLHVYAEDTTKKLSSLSQLPEDNFVQKTN